jgi:zinc transport system permease protein
MTINQLLAYFQYEFILRSFFIGLIVAVIAAALGHFLVLKKMSLIGDGLAHVAYFSIALSLIFFSQSIWFNLLIATLAAWFIQFLIHSNKGYSDAVIGVVSTLAIALGTILINTNLTGNVRVEQFLFGSILLLRQTDMIAVIIVAMLVIGFIGLNFRELMTLTFDSDYAQVNDFQPKAYQFALATLTSWLVIIGIRASGSLMISSFLIFPAMIVLNFKQGFIRSFYVGIIVALVNFVIGFVLSLWFDLPTGSVIVVTYGTIWLLVILFQSLRRHIRL